MKRFRGTTTVVISISLMALTACGGTNTDTMAGSTPPSAGSTVPSSTAPSPAAATSAPAAASGVNDAKLCTQANAAGDAWKAAWIKAFREASANNAEPAASELKKALTDFASALNTAAGTSDSKAAAAAKQMAASSAKAAAAADPNAVFSSDADFDNAVNQLATACKASGVTIPV